jgi:hypothetical protein
MTDMYWDTMWSMNIQRMKRQLGLNILLRNSSNIMWRRLGFKFTQLKKKVCMTTQRAFLKQCGLHLLFVRSWWASWFHQQSDLHDWLDRRSRTLPPKWLSDLRKAQRSLYSSSVRNMNMNVILRLKVILGVLSSALYTCNFQPQHIFRNSRKF